MAFEGTILLLKEAAFEALCAATHEVPMRAGRARRVLRTAACVASLVRE